LDINKSRRTTPQNIEKNLGPVQNEDGSRRIRMNYELNELIENADVLRFIKKQKNSQAGSRDADG